MDSNTILGQRLIAAKLKSRSVLDDGDIGLIVRYKGAQASATVEVASTTGDITFKHGAPGSETVDGTIDSGGNDPGVIDVSDASADTMGEVVDLINASPNWEAYLVDVLRTDDSRTLLLTLSAAQAHKGIVPQGVRLFKDSSQNDNFDISIAIMKRDFPSTFQQTDLAKINVLTGYVSNNTFGSGTNTIRVYEINPNTKVETLVYSRPGGATTVTQTVPSTEVAISSDPGNYLLVRMVSSAAAASGFLTVMGKTY